MISQPIDAYTSAPAAFGDHEPHADYSEQDFTNEYGFESYLFDHSYPPMENSSWMERGEYSLGSPRTETNCRSHVNPSSLGSNFPDYGLKSGQTVVKDSKFLTSPSASKIKIKSTSINISAHGKVDRKTLKRMRNRVSASRCRIKKKEWIHDLEDESKALSNQNKMLLEKIASLEESIAAYSAGRG